jgi:ribosome-associated heat shock protein Hsp15
VSTTSQPGARLDKWLWTVRAFKTRALATDACRGGSVEINGRPAKPARDVHAGDEIKVRKGLVTHTLRVLGAPASRVAAKLVAGFCEDLTPAAELEKGRRTPVQQFLAREKGSGRPTKRDRRQIEQLFG